MGQDKTGSVSDEDFSPTGTAWLLGIYFLILVALWVFMYFIEFLGGTATIISH